MTRSLVMSHPRLHVENVLRQVTRSRRVVFYVSFCACVGYFLSGSSTSVILSTRPLQRMLTEVVLALYSKR